MTAAGSGSVSGRELLLLHLKQGRGAWVSGQFLSERMAMTRSAVWKQIGALKADGYVIESSTRKGYRLIGVPDLLRIEEVRDGLRTRVLGRTEARHYRETDSTNSRARELAAGGAPEGTLVVAEEQSSGRGRRERTWFSPPFLGIYASLVLRPSIPPGEAPRMAILAAVAVADALRSETGLPVTIKWPNDILAGGRKIAGILMELATDMGAVDYLVIGTGINVNVPAGVFPREIRPLATSVLVETGKPFPRVRLLRRCLESFESCCDLFAAEGFSPLLARWKSMSSMIGKPVVVHVPGRDLAGIVADIDENGFLLLRDDGGRDHRIFSGDVTLPTGIEKG
ncbi:MAG: biotin--[acetyl-CoA-carboxylase] ligase [Syntrophaceae bacterium]|nr:biotin--[acetyl-CoA-carboxylase] ligase [Syntrophaceae bacterium]